MPLILRRPRVVAALLLAAATALFLALALSGASSPVTPASAAPPVKAAKHKGTSLPKDRRPGKRALKMIWGPNTLPDGSSAFPTYKSLGVDVLQTQLSWRGVAKRRPADPRNPNDPAYAWPAALDTTMSGAQSEGIRVSLLVRQTPAWANGGKTEEWAPDDPQDFADFLIAASKRYPKVRQWQIWGEPSRASNFQPMPANSKVGPRRYALLVDRAYGALKSVTKHNKVIGGMTWTVGDVKPLDFIRWMRLPNGRAPRMDYYGHNPYSRRFPKISDKPYSRGIADINDIDTLYQRLKRAYGPRRKTPQIWISEFSVSVTKGRAFDFGVGLGGQGKWVTAAFKLANKLPYVVGLGWYSLVDESGSGAITSGLLTRSGAQKPAFRSYRRAK